MTRRVIGVELFKGRHSRCIMCINQYIFPFPSDHTQLTIQGRVDFFWGGMSPHVPYGLRGLLSRFWSKCNRLLRLGRPQGAVTFTRWCEWWYIYIYERGVPGSLKPKFYRLPRPWRLWGSSPTRENSHGLNGNRTQASVRSSDHQTTRGVENLNMPEKYQDLEKRQIFFLCYLKKRYRLKDLTYKRE
jgi:hypothetical protein